MTTLEDFKKGIIHALLVGYPGSGKTGSCAALANSGYNLWIIDFDRNPDPLIEFVKPEFKKNVNIAQFSDPKEMKKFEVKGKLVDKLVPKGTPMAYSHAIRQLNTWVPELDRRMSINFEDNAIVTENGIEFLYPPNEKIIIIR